MSVRIFLFNKSYKSLYNSSGEFESSLMNSIDHDFILHSGHGQDTTLSDELNKNPFLIPLKNKLN